MKTKTRLIQVFSIIFLTFVGPVVGLSTSNNETDERIPELLIGSWTGQLNVQGTELPIIFRFEKTDEGLGAFLDSPTQQAFNIPSSALTVKDQRITVEFSVIGMTITAELKGPDLLEGKLKQGEFQAPLDLSRVKK